MNYTMTTSSPQLFTTRFSRRAKIRLGCSLSECPNELEWVLLRRARDTQQAFHITPCQDAFLGMSQACFSFFVELERFFSCSEPVLRIRIREPVSFWPLDPGSRMCKKIKIRAKFCSIGVPAFLFRKNMKPQSDTGDVKIRIQQVNYSMPSWTGEAKSRQTFCYVKKVFM